MIKNETLDAVLDVLKEHGIETTIAQGGKHLQVRWANRLGEPRFVTVHISSEMHAVRNARHQVRSILREDGMLPEAIPKIPQQQRPIPLTRYDQLERDMKELTTRVARVEQLLKGSTA